jgi:hypothetical protein
MFRIDPRAGILDTDKRPILQTLGTHAKHVGTIGDGGHGVDCIRKEVQKHLLQLYSIGSDRAGQLGEAVGRLIDIAAMPTVMAAGLDRARDYPADLLTSSGTSLPESWR